MSKKMCKSVSPLSELLNYSFPKLHEGKKWYVDFRALDPASGEIKRKKYHIPDDLPRKEKLRRANLIITTLSQKLASGWNPWVSATDARAYTLFADVVSRYTAYLEKFGRYKTRHSYASRLHILHEFIEATHYPITYAYQYDTAFVTAFLDYIYLDRECGARTRNNYRGWCSSFADWMIERGYISANPCQGLAKISEAPKRRQPLTDAQLRRLYDYLYPIDKPFLTACLFEYFTFIRPTELVNIKVADISIKDSRVFVSRDFSKNKRDGYVALNPILINLLIEIGSLSSLNSNFLFGKDFLPNRNKAGADIFNKRWAKLRHALGWSDELQFYSLKDSGIRDLANAAGIVYARDQARHTDITTTNKYIQGRNSAVPEATKNFLGAFGDYSPIG
jgi:integrase